MSKSYISQKCSKFKRGQMSYLAPSRHMTEDEGNKLLAPEVTSRARSNLTRPTSGERHGSNTPQLKKSEVVFNATKNQIRANECHNVI